MCPLPTRWAPLIVSLLCAASAVAQDRFHVTGAFRPEEPMPLNVIDLPVDDARTLHIEAPPEYNSSNARRALLWLAVRDIDQADEAEIYVNGRGPYTPPQSLIGEGGGHEGRSGYIPLETTVLQPDSNEIRFVFRSDLGGTTNGYQVIDAALLIASDEPTRAMADIHEPVERYIDLPNFGTLAVLDRSLSPYKVRLVSDGDRGWKPHTIRRGDGRGGWTVESAEHRFLHVELGAGVMPTAIERFDDGRVVIFAAWNDGRRLRPVMLTSTDGGETWSDWRTIAGVFGRPSRVAYAGNGDVSFEADGYRYFSGDGGRTWYISWRFRLDIPPAPNDAAFLGGGQPLVERQSNGEVHIAVVGYNYGASGSTYDPAQPSVPFFRRSTDGGVRWTDTVSPRQWTRELWHEGKRSERAVSDGSLVRAADNAIVASLRTDVPVELIDRDSRRFEGLAVSRSLDNGRTWSPLNVLYPAGRTSGHFVTLPDDRIALIYVVGERLDDELRYADFRRGCEALISDDNGRTWRKDRCVILDEWAFATPERTGGFTGPAASVMLEDESVLTAYAHEPSAGIVLVKWKP